MGALSDLEILTIERACEVKYDHLQGDRFRHAAIFLRWRPDKPSKECRYDQLEVTTPYDLAEVITRVVAIVEQAVAARASS